MRKCLAVVLSMVLSSSAWAADAGITVLGEARITAVPDVVCIDLAVVSDEIQFGKAVAANAATTQKVYDSLYSLGVGERDFATTGFRLETRYKYRKEDERVFDGYRVVNAISVKVRNVASAGRVVDGLVAAGANHIAGVRFEVSNLPELVEAARGEAVKSAKKKAALMVAAAEDGSVLGRVKSITGGENAGDRGGSYEQVELQSGRMGSTPVTAGQKTYNVTVQVVFDIVKK